MRKNHEEDLQRLQKIENSVKHDCTVCRNMQSMTGKTVTCAPFEWKAGNMKRIVPEVCKCSRFRFDIDKVDFDKLAITNA